MANNLRWHTSSLQLSVCVNADMQGYAWLLPLGARRRTHFVLVNQALETFIQLQALISQHKDRSLHPFHAALFECFRIEALTTVAHALWSPQLFTTVTFHFQNVFKKHASLPTISLVSKACFSGVCFFVAPGACQNLSGQFRCHQKRWWVKLPFNPEILKLTHISRRAFRSPANCCRLMCSDASYWFIILKPPYNAEDIHLEWNLCLGSMDIYPINAW